jgi:hypothetical protein
MGELYEVWRGPWEEINEKPLFLGIGRYHVRGPDMNYRSYPCIAMIALSRGSKERKYARGLGSSMILIAPKVGEHWAFIPVDDLALYTDLDWLDKTSAVSDTG